MNPWHKGRLLAFDLETTSPLPEYARIVTATVIELGPTGKHVHEWMASLDVDIPAGATAIHGVSTERARAEGQPTEQVVFEVLTLLGPALAAGVPVIAYNAAFDLTVMDRECARHSIDSLGRRGDVAPVVDPYVLDKHLDPYRRGKRTLTVTAGLYGIDLGNAHDATADALAAARLAYALAGRYPDVIQVPLDQLHREQTAWRAEQSTSLQAYFTKQGKPQPVNGQWPVQSPPPGWDPAFHPVDEATVGAA